ncbi:MAG: hypothetical protein AB8F95_05125 [Bacteroidia bacterium]
MSNKIHLIAPAFSAWCTLASHSGAGFSAFRTFAQKIMVSAMAASGILRVAVVFPDLQYNRMIEFIHSVLFDFSISAITLTKEIFNAFLFAGMGSNSGVLVQIDIENGLSKTTCLSFNCNC